MSLRSMLAAIFPRLTIPVIEDKTLPPTREGTYTVATKRRGENIPVRIRFVQGRLTVVAHDGWAESMNVNDFWRGYEVTSWEVRN